MTYQASEAGAHFVFMICQPCAARLARLPTSTQVKALNRAADNVLHDPGRYAHRAFADAAAAHLFCALAGDPATAPGVVDELMRGDVSTK